MKASQAESGSYNAGEATATITVEEALTLSSIAITTAPTKTTYEEGEIFDATGMVVTATYSDNSTDDVTALCTWTPSGTLTTTDTEITISYTENGTTKTATQAITVNEYVQPTSIDITLNNAFFNSTATSNVNDASLVGTQDRVTVTINKNDGNKLYVNASQIRLYNKNTMVLTAPTGYAFTEIELVEPSSDKSWAGSSNTSAPTGYDDSSKTWTGVSNTVTITFGGTCRVGGLNITLTNIVPVTVTSAGFATYVSDADLDYSGLDVKAYKATVSGTDITFTKVTTVPAGEGVLLQGAGTFNVPVAASAVAAWADDDNAFVRGTGAAVETGDGPYNYILNEVDGVAGFYQAAGKTVAKNRAYLQSTSSQARIALNFGEASGIDETVLVRTSGQCYNLQGQRVMKPTKGLYIVNGKKMFNK